MSNRIPEQGEAVYDMWREARQMQPSGHIDVVDENEERIYVKFPGNTVEWQGDWIEWNGTRTCHRMPRINGMLHHSNDLLEHPEMAFGNTDEFKRYYFDDLEWSTSVGGFGAWIRDDERVS